MRCFHVVVVAFLGIITNCTSSRHDGCYGSFIKECENNQPLFLNKTSLSYEFILPKNGTVSMRPGEKIEIACSEPKNFLVNSYETISTGVCTKGKIRLESLSGSASYDFNDLQCNKSIHGDIRTTNKRCGNNEGYLTNIGYYIGSDFLTLIEICYDGDKGRSLYADHTIHGDSVRNASKSSRRPSFNTLGVGRNVSASVAYKNAFQKATFNKLLGSSALADLYINRKSYLSRGHLAPDADFLFAAWQFTTYFYINACPQWQVINGGNWQKIESMIRRKAASLRQNLRIITGTHGVLALQDVNGKLVDIYLTGGDRLPVPKYVWKIVYDESSRKAIALINLNDPFVKELGPTDYFCKSICEEMGWNNKNWTRLERGVVHCCEYKDFVKIVQTSPKFKVAGVLEGPYFNSRRRG